jgi:hypothetical protein
MEARLLTKPEAAAYCKLTTAAFDDWRRRSILPGPIPGTRRWDRVSLDKALDKASGLQSESAGNAYDQWKAHAQAR